jgi:hypothetical protein
MEILALMLSLVALICWAVWPLRGLRHGDPLEEEPRFAPLEGVRDLPLSVDLTSLPPARSEPPAARRAARGRGARAP